MNIDNNVFSMLLLLLSHGLTFINLRVLQGDSQLFCFTTQCCIFQNKDISLCQIVDFLYAMYYNNLQCIATLKRELNIMNTTTTEYIKLFEKRKIRTILVDELENGIFYSGCSFNSYR